MTSVLYMLQEVMQAKQVCARRGIAMDGVYSSPGEVYRKALSKLGHDTSGLRRFDDTNAAEVTFNALQGKPPRRAAMDSAATTAGRSAMFPNANRLQQVS